MDGCGVSDPMCSARSIFDEEAIYDTDKGPAIIREIQCQVSNSVRMWQQHPQMVQHRCCVVSIRDTSAAHSRNCVADRKGNPKP